jgi:hypothetical protein
MISHAICILRTMLFTYPAFLYALLAVSIPILLHLFQLRRYKKIVFSDIRFLKTIDEQTRSNKKLKEWLILASRVMVITALVFAFAQPYLPISGNTTENNAKLISIYIDNSASMQLEGKNGTLLEEAKNKARSIVEAYSAGTAFHIITNTETHGTWKPLTAGEAIDYIAAIQPQSGGLATETLLQKQRMAAERNSSAKPVFYYLSDFQQSQWKEFKAFPHDSSITYNFIPVQPNSVYNVSIDTAWLESPIVKINKPANIYARISNRGDSRTDISVQLLADGIQKGIQTVSLEKNESQKILFQVTPDSDKPIRVSVSLRDHPLNFDDELNLVLQPVASFDVLCVNGSNNDTYLKALFEAEPGINYTSGNQNQIDFSTLSTKSLIILNGCSNLPSGTVAELTKYLHEGGILFFIPAEDAAKTISNNDWLMQLNAPVFGSVKKSDVQVSSVDTKHELLRQVFTQIPKNADWPKATQYYVRQSLSSITGKAIIRLNSGEALLWQTSAKKGQLFLLNVPLSDAFSNFHKHALFVPLMLNMATLNATTTPIYYVCGMHTQISIAGKLSGGTEKTLQLVGRQRSLTTSAIFINGKYTAAIPHDIIPGFYTIEGASQKNVLGQIALNETRDESDMKFYTEQDIEKLTVHLANSTTYTVDARVLFATISKSNNGKPLWRWFVVAAFIFILLEILLLRVMK